MNTESLSAIPSEQERQALREKNMEAFRRKYPPTAHSLENHQPLAQLVFDDHGNPDLEFMGNRFYDGNIKSFTETQLETYWKSPYRLLLPQIQAEALDGYGSYALHRAMDKITNEHGITHEKDRQTKESFYLIIEGIGLAPHLDELVEQTQCRNVILIDANMEGFYHSLEVYDWEKLLTKLEHRNGDVFFFITSDPQMVIDALRIRIRGSAVTAIDGTYVYQHFISPMFDEFTKMFNKQAGLMLAGLGFFYDEQIMIGNARTNLVDGTARFYLQSDQPAAKPCPAFVVGCGPSIDTTIEYLKENADRGVIISCGSALGPLMAAGIKPDFQIEMENLEVATVIKFVVEDHDISDICLVAASTVDIEAPPMFKERVFYHRAALSPYPVFSNNPKNFIKNLDPTVVNAGLGFVQELGFNEIYLFGVDMGQRGTDRHHASVSYHYTEGAIIAQSPFNIEVPANFGGKAKTTSGLAWAIDSLQRLVSQGPRHVKYFNCSDGAKLKGIQPKLARTVTLPELPDGKTDIVKAIIDGFPPFSKQDFEACWNLERMTGAINQMSDSIRDILKGWDDHTDDEPRISLNILFHHQSPENSDGIFASLMLRGTFNMIVIAWDYHVHRASTIEMAQKSHEVFRAETLEVIEICRNKAIENLATLEAGNYLPLDYLKAP